MSDKIECRIEPGPKCEALQKLIAKSGIPLKDIRQETGQQVPPVVTRQLLNKEGETYWLTIAMAPSEAGRFLREMWESVGGICCPQTDEEALGEWTDRGRDVRTKYDQLDGIRIHTHAWHPDGDKHVLDEAVLRFLRGRGLSV